MEVKAQLNNYRRSPRKIRLVAKVLKGLDAKAAENQLRFIIKGSAEDFQKLLKSAVSNAENNFGLEKDNLFIKDIIVNEGTKLKRWLPRAYGRASLLLKRTSHIELILAERVEGKGRKKVKKQEIKDVKAEEIKKKEEKETEEIKEEKKEITKIREEKEFIDEKKKSESSKGILKRVFRRKSM
jgi:large subunit ribosomal protein L22